MDGFVNFIYGGYDYPEHFPSPVTYIIVILDTLWMLFIFYFFILDTQRTEFPKNSSTFQINCFLPKLRESYGA